MLAKILCFIIFCLVTTNIYAQKIQSTFEPAEHMYIADEIKIYFSADDIGKTQYIFTLANQLKVSYSDLVALPDFYGVLGSPVSLAPTLDERKKRFIAYFNTLAQDPHSFTEAKQIITVIDNEKEQITNAIAQGKNPEQVYAEVIADNDRQYNCITGGGCLPDVWWLDAGRYLKLQAENYDHTEQNAWLTYEAGHAVALDTALHAHQTQNAAELELAYAYDAFACHFLSDRFSAGHIRTPRYELANHVTPATIGSLLSSYMHAEENQYGIHVHNQRGDHWYAYGDEFYFNKYNKMNRELIRETLQTSANEVFSTYQTGVLATENVYPLIPFADETGNLANADISPLFYWDEKTQTMYKRNDISNVYDRHWTNDWWGWSTFLQLKEDRGMPLKMRATLVQAGLTKEAKKYGVI